MPEASQQPLILRLGRGRFLGPFLVIFALWAATRLPFFTWGLPNPAPLEPDSPWAGLNYGVKEQMANSGYGYPPLQYMVYGAVFPKTQEGLLTKPGELLEARSARIAGMRAIVSLMALGTALAIAFGVLKLTKSPFGAACAGAFSLLPPLSVERSLSVDMNCPYAFWWSLALLLALLPALRSKRGAWERASDLAAGLCLGLSAATKDQIYSFLFVPCLALALLWRERGWRRALESAALWAGGALSAWLAVWLLAGDGSLEPLKNHISMIAGGGSPKGLTSSEPLAPDFAGRLKLLLWSAESLLRCVDWPLAALLASALPFLFKESSENMGGLQSPLYRRAKLALLFAVAAFVSTEAFFLQAVMFSEPRFMMPVMPFLCLAGGIAMARLRAFPMAAKLTAGIAILAMAAIAFQTGLSMAGDSRTQLRSLMEDEFSNGKPGVMAVEGLSESKVFAFAGGKPEEVRKIRDWGLNVFGRSCQQQRSILLEPFFLAMLEPRIVATKGLSGDDAAKLLEDAGFTLAGGVYPEDGSIYTFYRHQCPTFMVYSKTSEREIGQRLQAQMSSIDLNSQLLRLQMAVDDKQAVRQASMIGPLLAPFKGLDLQANNIRVQAVGFAAFAYEKAGRVDDAAAAHFACLTRFDDNAFARNAFAFFQRNPAMLQKFNLKIQRGPDGSSTLVRERPKP